MIPISAETTGKYIIPIPICWALLPQLTHGDQCAFPPGCGACFCTLGTTCLPHSCTAGLFGLLIEVGHRFKLLSQHPSAEVPDSILQLIGCMSTRTDTKDMIEFLQCKCLWIVSRYRLPRSNPSVNLPWSPAQRAK